MFLCYCARRAANVGPSAKARSVTATANASTQTDDDASATATATANARTSKTTTTTRRAAGDDDRDDASGCQVTDHWYLLNDAPVYIPRAGKKYHLKKKCGSMTYATKVPLTYAMQFYEPCGNCYVLRR